MQHGAATATQYNEGVDTAFSLDSLWAEQSAGRLAHLRQRRGLSASALAEAAGLSKSTISRIENCEREPTMSQKALIALALEADVQAIWPSPTHVELCALAERRVAA